MYKEDVKYKEYRNDSQERNDKAESDMLDRLVRDGEWTELKQNKRYQELSTEGKIIKALDAVNVRERAINKMFYEELPKNPANSSVIYKKGLVPLRNLQSALRARYVGELDPKDAPREMTTILDISVGNQPRLDRSTVKKAL